MHKPIVFFFYLNIPVCLLFLFVYIFFTLSSSQSPVFLFYFFKHAKRTSLKKTIVNSKLHFLFFSLMRNSKRFKNKRKRGIGSSRSSISSSILHFSPFASLLHVFPTAAVTPASLSSSYVFNYSIPFAAPTARVCLLCLDSELVNTDY